MMPKPAQLAAALAAATAGTSDKDAAAIVRRFAGMLEKKGMASLLPLVAADLPSALKAAAGVEDVLIESAHPVSDAMIKEILVALGIAPSKADVTMKVSPELLGGVRIRRKDTVVDTTVRRGLDRLRAAAASEK